MRVSTGKVRRKSHKRILKANKGYVMSKSTLYKVAHEAYMHAGQYSLMHRRKKPGQMRETWTKRISGAARTNGLTYSKLMSGLKKADIQLNRKSLSEIAVNNPAVFTMIVKSL